MRIGIEFHWPICRAYVLNLYSIFSTVSISSVGMKRTISLFNKVTVLGFPRWLSGKQPTCQCRRLALDPWVGKIPWRKKCQSTLVFLLGKIPWTEEPGRLQSMGFQRVTKLERLNNNNKIVVYQNIVISAFSFTH